MRALRLGFIVLSLVCWGCGDSSSSSEPDGGGDQTVGTPDSARSDTANPVDSAGSDLSRDGASSDGGNDSGAADGASEPDAGPQLACTTLVPTAGYNGAAVALTIDGQLFEQTATVTLQNLVTSEAITLADPTITDSNDKPGLDQITAAIAAGVAEGTYAVVVLNPGSEESVDCGTYVSTAQSPPTVTDVAPDTAWEGNASDAVLSDQPVSITGTGFSPTPAVRFINEQSREVFNATSVGWVSPTSLTAVCPSESQQMPVGEYLVEVVNPSRLSGSWTKGDGSAEIFSVTATPPPRIDDVSPIKALVSAGGGKPVDDVTITGDFFQQETQIFLLHPGGVDPQDITASVTAHTIDPAGPDQIVFPFNVNALGLQVGIYPLRLVNPDGQFDTFFSLQVENSAEGKLNAGQWETSSLLVDPRDKHDAVFGFDVFGNGYLFVVGGTSLPLGGDLASRPRPVLGNTEVVQVDNFGDPIAQSVVLQQLRPQVDLSQVDPRTGLEAGDGAKALRSTNSLLTPRSGLTVVRAGAYLYAIGGAAEDSWDPAKTGQIAALDTVERATILGYVSMPNLSLPRVLRASRGLPRGSWFYRVSAVRGELGESLPSREVVAQDAGGHISLKWLPVEGATSYLVYRSPASDGRAGSVRLLATNVTGTSFLDDGQNLLSPAPGRLAGALQSGGALAEGDWTYRVTAVLAGTGETLASYPVTLRVADGADKTIALKWDPIADATYNVYRGANPGEQATALLESGLTSNSYADAGDPLEAPDTAAPDGITPLPPGSLGRWHTLGAKLTVGREGAQGVVVKAYDGDDQTQDEPSYVFVVGGRADNSTGAASLDTSERAKILDDGTLEPFALAATDAGATVTLNTPRAFFGLVTTQGRNITPVAPPPDIPPCRDDDGDGRKSCVCGGDDCNDGDASVYPGAEEVCGDGIDQDCDQGCAGGQDEACPDPCLADGGDGDGDGFKRAECGGKDCNDDDPTVCPDAQKCPEVCGDGVDQDCLGGDQACDVCDADGGDADGDGFKREECGGNDCNDDDPTVCPDRTQCPEVMCDGIDQDCDGYQPCIFFNDPADGSAEEDADAQVWGYDPRLKQSTRYFPPATQPLANGDEEEAPVYLGAIFGARSFPATASKIGAGDAEVTLVTKQGNLTAWTTQAAKPNNQPTFGNDALLYSSFCYSFLGAQMEGGPGTDPSGIVNQVFYWKVDETAIADWSDPVPATILQKPDTSHSSGSPVPAGSPELQQLPRAFFSAVRLSAFVFGVAGNGGAGIGPLKSVIQIKQ